MFVYFILLAELVRHLYYIHGKGFSFKTFNKAEGKLLTNFCAKTIHVIIDLQLKATQLISVILNFLTFRLTTIFFIF